jgi:dihydrofolate reductase
VAAVKFDSRARPTIISARSRRLNQRNVLERRKESEMRKVIVNEFMSLDGVVQAPGAADEDTSGGFEHGGWHLRYFDDVSQKRVLDSIVEAGGFLLGRLTYEIFAAYWPNASEEEQVIAEPLNTKPKYVASTALTEPLAWQNSTLLRGDVSEAVSALKRDDGADVHVIGSTQLVQALIEHGLVDEFRLMIDPVVLGGGKRIFREDGALRTLRLVDGEITSTGAILATYAPAA